MKGIILAGGSGTRLYPLTTVVSKQLLPIYDKPMIYYPLSTLMLSGIREIIIISTPTDLPNYQRLLGDGSDFGTTFQYVIQPKPEGLAQAFIICKELIGDEPCAMCLGDNIFYGNGFIKTLNEARSNAEKGLATIFGYSVNDPNRFGIMEIGPDGNVLSVEEKPEKPKSNYCITGLYFFPKGVSDYADLVRPSSRGELEITSLINMYLEEKKLKSLILGRGFAWLDTGTMDSLIDASLFVQLIQKRQGIIVSAPEEVAFRNGWISKDKLMENANKCITSSYGQHLMNVAAGKVYRRRFYGKNITGNRGSWIYRI